MKFVMYFNKSIFFVLLVFFIFGCTTESSTRKYDKGIDLSCEGCNVLFINIANLRADYVGLLNPEKNLTPNIDKFFKDSIIFEQATSASGATYLSATATATSTETMLNEHNPYREYGGFWSIVEVVQQDGKLLVDYFPTIAEVLSNNRYHTSSINEWIHTGEKVYLDRGFQDYTDITSLEDYGSIEILNPLKKEEREKRKRVYLFEEQIDMMSDIIRNIRNSSFFLYFHSNSLHIPLRYPLDRITSNSQAYPIIRNLSRADRNFLTIRPEFLRILMANTTSLFWENVTYKTVFVQAYENQLRYMDEELSRLFNFLQEDDMLENTIVVMYSNHGNELWDHDIYNVGVSYQSSVHVPLLIKHPRIKERIRVISPISLIDLAPTLYEMLGITIKHAISGYSLVPLLTTGEYEREFIFGRDVQWVFVRKGDWKLIINADRGRSLYNIKDDPAEQINLIKEFPSIVMELEAALIEKKMQQLGFAKQMKEYFNVSKLN